MTKVKFMTIHEVSLKRFINNELFDLEEKGCKIKDVKIGYKESGIYAVLIIYEAFMP